MRLETWESVYKADNVNRAYNNFIETFTMICDKHAPFVERRKSSVNTRKPWITRAIKKSIKVKHKLYKKMIVSKFKDECVSKYKRYRNLLTTVLRNARRTYYCQLFEAHKEDTGQTWKSINELLGRNKSKSQQIEKISIGENGERGSITTPNEICEAFNDFFVNVGPNLANKIQEEDDMKPFCEYLTRHDEESLVWQRITQSEVKDQLVSLNVKKSFGFDNIPARLLKDAADYIAYPLSYIFNMSLSKGVFPDTMKIAKVTPVYKKGEKDILGNYRPISVLPLLAKVLEKIINKQLLHYFETNNLFYDEQYGFRKNYSTKLSLASLVNVMSKSLDEGKITLGVFIDFRKAFDTINHNILCKKLEYYGVKGLPLQWIRNYLSNRTQFVTYDGKLSCKKAVTCGVPQGSVLGPTLFLIYINDLPASSEYFTFKIVADDTNLFHTFPARENDIDMLQINRHLQDVVNWCKVNKLTINISKLTIL